MDVTSKLIFGLWYAAILANAIALATLIYKRLARTYLLLSMMLSVSLLKSLWLLWAYFGGAGYRSAWIASQTLMIVVGAGVTLEAFVLQSRHCYKFRSFG